jgi:hypothetical protein
LIGVKARALILALLLALLGASAASAAKPKPIFWKNYGKPVAIEPARVDIDYGTGFAWVSGLTEWEDWGTVSATARGVFHLNDCRPNCAAGHYRSHSARVTLFKVRHCHGQRRYLDVKVQPRGLPLATWGSDCRGAQVTSP